MTTRLSSPTTRRFFVLLISLLVLPLLAASGEEEKFAVLNTKIGSFTNAQVTTKAAKYVFVHHSTGMSSIPLAALAEEDLATLGYGAGAGKPKPTALAAAVQSLPKMETLQKAWNDNVPANTTQFKDIKWSSGLLLQLLGMAFLLYFLFSYCAMLICKKTGNEPGLLVWLPVFQLIPLVRAAGMTPVWFIAFLIPVMNIIAQIVWSVNIAKARGKSFLTALFLILPFTTPLAFLYLALSNGVQREKSRPRPRTELMTLETA